METDVIQFKQFVIVPKKPRMSAGKIASQVAHATFMALEKQKAIINNIAKQEKCVSEHVAENYIEDWKDTGMCVIVLECDDTLQLMGISKYCEEWKVPHHMYIDEGITEIRMGTPTALATGVLPLDKHWMFNKLKLFKG